MELKELKAPAVSSVKKQPVRCIQARRGIELGVAKKQIQLLSSVSFWLEHFQTRSSGFENELQGRKRQFLLLKVKMLSACAGDLFYSS